MPFLLSISKKHSGALPPVLCGGSEVRVYCSKYPSVLYWLYCLLILTSSAPPGCTVFSSMTYFVLFISSFLQYISSSCSGFSPFRLSNLIVCSRQALVILLIKLPPDLSFYVCNCSVSSQLLRYLHFSILFLGMSVLFFLFCYFQPIVLYVQHIILYIVHNCIIFIAIPAVNNGFHALRAIVMSEKASGTAHFHGVPEAVCHSFRRA